jgi:hypothetical protein
MVECIVQNSSHAVSIQPVSFAVQCSLVEAVIRL